MTLYHGSFVAVPRPIALYGRRRVDFGQGFYLTSIRQQAESWAKSVAFRHAKPTAVLGRYAFDEVAARELLGPRYRIFSAYDSDWLAYVVDCRKGGSMAEDFDVVEGGVANDNVIDTVELYEQGDITAEQALGQLAFKKVNHQICIRSQEIVDSCLEFLGSEEVPL